jgi:hypothetical protein
MIEKSRPTVERFLAYYLPDIRTLAQSLREIIEEAVPEHVEVVYPVWQRIGYWVKDGPSLYFIYSGRVTGLSG